MTYHLILYDFDGTLADSFPFFVSVINRLAHHHHFNPVGPADIDALRELDAKHILTRLGLPRWKMPAVLHDFQRLMSDRIEQIALFPGVDAMLSALVAHHKTLAIVTSNSWSNVTRLLGPDHAALIHHYQCGVSFFGKPGKVKRILRATGIPPAAAIYIGDEVRDAEAAHATGVAFGAVSWGYTRLATLLEYAPQAVFAHPDDVIRHLTDAG